MNVPKLFAMVLIFAAVSLAWMVLGGSLWARTEMLDKSLSGEMASLWGPDVLAQASPYWTPAKEGGRDAGPAGASGTASIPLSGALAPDASAVTADIRQDHRYKGLLWYSTFTVDFRAAYTLRPSEADGTGAAQGVFVFPLPAGVTAYSDLEVKLDEKVSPVPAGDVSAGRIVVPVRRDAEHVVHIRYTAGGQNEWLYAPWQPQAENAYPGTAGPGGSAGHLCELKDFQLTVTTDFTRIDYPKGTRSPNAPAEKTGAGVKARWQFANALTSQAMGVTMPRRANAGPIAARMSFFAPVSLFFFCTVLFAVVVLKKVPLHPMHYLFISAGFFAFHILMAYLADLVDIHAAFWISAAVSAFLVASYMRLVAGMRFTLAYVCISQMVYLVGFSYAFFWVGRTGLTVTIGAVATLFVLMQATGRVNWNEAFSRPTRPCESRP